jgi:hypothetical protein
MLPSVEPSRGYIGFDCGFGDVAYCGFGDVAWAV